MMINMHANRVRFISSLYDSFLAFYFTFYSLKISKFTMIILLLRYFQVFQSTLQALELYMFKGKKKHRPVFLRMKLTFLFL